MSRFQPKLRVVVFAWTLFTTTFLWTPTMRMFLKPEVSRWSVLGLSGAGREGAFWIFPVGVALVLLLFYLEGRGRLRPLVYLLLLGWHLPIAAGLIYWAARAGAAANFVGAAWGWRVPFAVLAVPFSIFSALAVLWVWRDARRSRPVEPAGWLDVRWRSIAISLALFPVAIVFFRLGQGFDGWVRAAIVTNIVQWILLAEGVGGRSESGRERPGRGERIGGPRPAASA